jgi:hypothetical protein
MVLLKNREVRRLNLALKNAKLAHLKGIIAHLVKQIGLCLFVDVLLLFKIRKIMKKVVELSFF